MLTFAFAFDDVVDKCAVSTSYTGTTIAPKHNEKIKGMDKMGTENFIIVSCDCMINMMNMNNIILYAYIIFLSILVNANSFREIILIHCEYVIQYVGEICIW